MLRPKSTCMTHFRRAALACPSLARLTAGSHCTGERPENFQAAWPLQLLDPAKLLFGLNFAPAVLAAPEQVMTKVRLLSDKHGVIRKSAIPAVRVDVLEQLQ